MADDVIKSYLVGLGFKIDNESLRKFNEQLSITGTAVKAFAASFVGLAVTIEEAIRRTASEFENLFFLSQQTGVAANTLKAFDFSMQQIGLSAGQTNAQIARLNSAMLSSPGLRARVEEMTGGFKDAQDALLKLTQHYEYLIQTFGDNDARTVQWRHQMESMNIDVDWARQWAMNRKEQAYWEEKALQVFKNWGLEVDKQTGTAKNFDQQWRFAWLNIKTGIEVVSLDALPLLTTLLKDFITWLGGPATSTTEEWEESFKKWAADPETAKKIEGAIKGFVEDIKALKPAWDDFVEVMKATFWVIDKWVQAAKLLHDLLAPPSGTGVPAPNPEVIERLKREGKLPPDYDWEKEQRELQQRKGLSPYDPNATPLTPGGTPPPRGRGAGPTSTGQIESEGGMVPPIVMLLRGFAAWWSGSTAYSPIVALAAEVYEGLKDVLREVFGLGPGGSAPGFGGGEGSAAGVLGRHRLGGGGAGYGGGVSGTASVPKLAAGARVQQAMDYFISKGWSKDQAAGIVANLITESNLRTNVAGDAGHAMGIAQWHEDRQKKFQQIFGHNVKDGTYEEQLAFVNWELTHREGELSAGTALKRSTGGGGEAADIISRLYERPAQWVGRGPLGQRIASEYKPGGTVQGTTEVGPGDGPAGALGAIAKAANGVIQAVIGDSIAVGVAGALGLPSTDVAGGRAGGVSDAISGTTPAQIYSRVKDKFSQFANKTIALASGSNPNAGFSEEQMGYVKKTLEGLRKVGAHVVLLGVGRGVKDAQQINERLGQLAQQYGDAFTGELAGTARRGGVVHPDDYHKTIKQAHDALVASGMLNQQNSSSALANVLHPTRGGGRLGMRNIQSTHNVTVNVHGVTDPHGVARAVADASDRHSMIHARNLRTAIA